MSGVTITVRSHPLAEDRYFIFVVYVPASPPSEGKGTSTVIVIISVVLVATKEGRASTHSLGTLLGPDSTKFRVYVSSGTNPVKVKGKDLIETSKAKTTEKQSLKKQEKLVNEIESKLTSLKDLMQSTSLDGGEERSSAPTPRRPPPKD